MSFHMKMKRFVQGPNLHEESLALQLNSSSIVPPTPTKILSGEEAKHIYDEIINSASGAWQATSSTPSPDTSKSKPIQSSRSRTKTASQSNSIVSTMKKEKVLLPPSPKKSLNQLMALCETNSHSELETYINSHTPKSKFDINEQDAYGWSLLMSAACADATECLQLLLRNGASPSLKDKKGLTAVDLARKNRRKDALRIFEEWKHLYGDCGDGGIILIDLEDNEETTQQLTPVFCDACNQSFTNQTAHLKSIAHLFSSGVFLPDGKIHYGIPESNRGYQLMLKTGWDQASGLGPDGKGHKFPVKTVLKRDRQGVGNEKDKTRARITHFAPFDVAAVQGWRNRSINRDQVNPVVSTQKKAEFKRRTTKEKRKEIQLRRELGSL